MSEVMIDIELLTCPICSDTFVDACDTSCGHTFCEYCINCCLESKPDKCPVCSNDPSPTHPAFTIRSICEMIAPVKKQEEDDGQTLESEKEAGNKCYYKNKYAEAIVHYNNAIDKVTNSSDPKNCVLYNNRAQCYINLRQYTRALSDCNDAIRLSNTNVKAYMRKGLCLRQLGFFEESKKAYTKAMQLDTAKAWTPQIQDGLNSLPIFKPNTGTYQQPQQQPPQQPQQQQQRNSYQYPPPQQQQQQPMPNYYNPNAYNQQPQTFNGYPQFNPNHARYTAPNYPGGYVRTNTNPNYSTYYQPPQPQAQPQQPVPPQTNTNTNTNATSTSTTSTSPPNNVNNNTSSSTTSSSTTSTTSTGSGSNSRGSTAHEKKKSDCKSQ